MKTYLAAIAVVSLALLYVTAGAHAHDTGIFQLSKFLSKIPTMVRCIGDCTAQ